MKRYQALIDDRRVDLTPTEFRLLAALVRRQGEVAKERELLEEVWGEARPDEDSLVRRYVLMLRRKIEPDPARPHILLTIRGFGYRLGTGPLQVPGKEEES
jgi:DNA-binding response OmpR family regulator